MALVYGIFYIIVLVAIIERGDKEAEVRIKEPNGLAPLVTETPSGYNTTPMQSNLFSNPPFYIAICYDPTLILDLKCTQGRDLVLSMF